MPLGTLDRTPPPFFRQGPSALTRLSFFAALALLLMAADTRLGLTQPLRAAMATLLHPFERSLLVPVDAWDAGGEYLDGIAAAREAESRARSALAEQAQRLGRVEQLEQENAQLRELLSLRPRLTAAAQAAEVLYEAADPFTRKVVIDRGQTQGVMLGAPVLDGLGVVGQVTRVYPLTAEVTLMVDREAAIPVLNTRTQQRGVAFGDPGNAAMELRFMAGNADVQVGDQLVTSGLDGVYPAGLAVARVLKVDRRADSAFARITLGPAARPDSVRHVLVLEPTGTRLPPRPVVESAPSSRHDRGTGPRRAASR